MRAIKLQRLFGANMPACYTIYEQVWLRAYSELRQRSAISHASIHGGGITDRIAEGRDAKKQTKTREGEKGVVEQEQKLNSGGRGGKVMCGTRTG